MGDWKKLILGEKMPDKNDPLYKDRYEKELANGRRFAKWCGIDRVAAKVQQFASKYPKWFLTIVICIVVYCFSLNVCRIVRVCKNKEMERPTTATQHQEMRLKEYRDTKKI